MFEKKLEAGRHILTGKPIPLMRDGEEISGGYARWARAGRHSSSRPEGLFVYSGHCVGNGYGLLDGVRIYPASFSTLPGIITLLYFLPHLLSQLYALELSWSVSTR